MHHQRGFTAAALTVEQYYPRVTLRLKQSLNGRALTLIVCEGHIRIQVFAFR